MTLAYTLEEKKFRLDDVYVGVTFYAALFTGLIESFTCTFTNASTDITVTGNNFVVGMRVNLSTTGSLPGGFTAGTEYWIVHKSGSTIRLSATKGGSAISATGTGTGTHTMTELTPVKTIDGKQVCLHPLAALTRHEVTYNQSPGRKLMSILAASEVPTSGVARAATVSAVFAPSSPVTYRFWGVIRDGIATAGDNTGSLMFVEDYVNDQVISSSQSFDFTAEL